MKYNNTKADNELINTILLFLFKDSSEEGLNLETEILRPLGLNPDDAELRRITRVLTHTGFAQITERDTYDGDFIYVVPTGQVHLTSEGIKMLSEYSTYLDYLKKKAEIISKENADRKIKNLSSIATVFISLLSVATATLSIYISKNGQSDSETKIELLNKRIDSLSNKLNSTLLK